MNDFGKAALEAARLAAECTQLAGDSGTVWQRHYLKMAEFWTAHALSDPGTPPDADIPG